MVGESGPGNVSSLCKVDRKAALRDIKRRWRVEGSERWMEGRRDGGRHSSRADAKTRSPGMKTKGLIEAESGAPAERSPPQRDAAGAAGEDFRQLKKNSKKNSEKQKPVRLHEKLVAENVCGPNYRAESLILTVHYQSAFSGHVCVTNCCKAAPESISRLEELNCTRCG